jgi:LysM repeat protein
VKATGKQSLATIAKAEKVSTTQLKWFNPTLKVSSKTGRPLAGQLMRVPSEDALAFARDVPDPKIEKYGGSSSKIASSGLHVVRSGESLSVIARKYGTSVARLKSLNRMKGDKVRAGQTLRVRSGASVASSKKTVAKKKSTANKKN